MEAKQQFENAVKWIDALKSGEYRKTTCQLGKEDGAGNWSYCCLGVGCKVLGLHTSMLQAVSFELKDSVGLNYANGNFRTLQGFSDSLTLLNDTEFSKDKGFENMVPYIIDNIDTLFRDEVAKLLKEHYKKN